MDLGKKRHMRLAALMAALCLAMGPAVLAQDETEIDEQRIVIKTDKVDKPEKGDRDSIIIEHDGERRVIEVERSGIEDMVERIMESVEVWVEASAEAVERSIESIAAPHRERTARSEAGNTRDVNMTKSGFSGGDVEIYNISGKVDVRGWNRNEIKVEGTLGQDVDRLDFDASSNNAEIRVVVPKGRKRKIRSELTIYVPKESTVEIETVSATIDVEGLEGREHEMESVSGSVHVRKTSGAINVKSVSGQVTVDDADDDIEARNVSGSIQLKGDYPTAEVESVSGSIKVYGAEESIRAETVSGSMDLYGDNLEDLEAETVSGSLKYTGGLSEDCDVRLNSLSGSIRIKLDRPVEGEYDLETFSGSIHCNFGPSSINRSRGRGKHLVFVNGDGDAHIRVETFSGSLTISTQ